MHDYRLASLCWQGAACPTVPGPAVLPCLPQELLRDFLRDLAPVDAGSAQLATSAFQSYWSSLPWQQVGALIALRLRADPTPC